MAEELGERTELPSERKRSEARGRGSVPKSTDLGAAIDLVGGFLLIVLLGPYMFDQSGALIRALLGGGIIPPDATPADAVFTLEWTLTRMGWIIAPFLALMFAIAIFAQGLQVGLIFTLKPLEPKISQLNPIKGLGRIFGRRNLVKTIVSIVKLSVVGTIAIVVISGYKSSIAGLPALETTVAFGVVLSMIAKVTAWILAVLLIIGIIDYTYQKWQHTQDLRMTKQEVKDERRSMEGDMETRAKRMKMAREMMLQGLRQTVPQADVVVTNPTHYAVALKYDAATMDAPRVIAKGADYAALRIRELAAANGVPIVEKPPLARALYAGADVGRSISPQFYEAVAEILAYVYRLKGKAA